MLSNVERLLGKRVRAFPVGRPRNKKDRIDQEGEKEEGKGGGKR
jgi:hypothetical protein